MRTSPLSILKDKNIIIIFICVLCFLGQTHFVWSKEKSPNFSYDTKPFNLDANTIPPNYKGHDIERLYEKLKESPDNTFAEKSEFETYDAYMQRVHTYVSSVDIDLFTFVYKPRCSYKAEEQMLVCQVKTGARSPFFSADFEQQQDTVPIKLLDSKKSTYVGSTAFGLKTTVTALESYVYGIAFNKVRISEFVLKTPPDEAKKLKEDISILMIGKLKQQSVRPFFAFEYRFMSPEPTIHNRFDYTSYERFANNPQGRS